jgi:hypothetical protein
LAGCIGISAHPLLCLDPFDCQQDDAHCTHYAKTDYGGNSDADCRMRSFGMAETRYGTGDAQRGLGTLRATGALDCITNVPIGTCVNTQCGRQSGRERVRANAASKCDTRPGSGKRCAHILHARERIPPGSRRVGRRALSRARPACKPEH